MTSEPYARHLDDAPWDTRPGRTDGVHCDLMIDADRTLVLDGDQFYAEADTHGLTVVARAGVSS